ncbi:MAG: hypothetical protein JWM76_1437 [Pseudonocardiales bacterium]|nr:hypothetical protein [Pseudonocardiales bacterium]
MNPMAFGALDNLTLCVEHRVGDPSNAVPRRMHATTRSNRQRVRPIESAASRMRRRGGQLSADRCHCEAGGSFDDLDALIDAIVMAVALASSARSDSAAR